ncbi:MAG TPA: hypothetical protein VIN10_14190 [Bacteroidales bacterium]
MADNLESYFKKHLSDETPGDDNWNVPSDEVWDKVLPEIQKTKGVFIPWKYLYVIGGIIAAFFLLLFFWFSEFTVNTNEKIESITAIEENQQNQTSETTKDINIEIENQEQTLNNSEIIQENLTKSETDRYGKTELENIVTETNFNQTSSKETLLAKNDTKKSSTISTELEPGNKNEKIQFETLKPRMIDFLSVNFSSNSLKKSSVQTIEKSDLPSKKKEPFNNKNKFGIGIYYAPSFTSIHLSGDPDAGKIETSSEFYFSNNWGLELKYFISNRFTLITGVGRSEIITYSKSLTDFDYNTSTEHVMPGGEKENTSPVPMLTPFGEIDTEITYQFPGTEEIPDGEPMYSVMETNQQVRYLSIPLGIEYNLLRFSHFNWFVNDGLSYNRALQDATQFSSRILHNGHDMDVVSEKIMGNPTFNKSYLGFFVATGLNYQLSKSFQFSGSASYFGNITKVNVHDNMSTSINGFNLKIGILYIF